MSIFSGFYQLVTSPSSLFAMLCLGVMTWKASVLGPTPFVAFFGIVVPLLALAEHRETMCQLQQPPPPPIPPPANLPDKGTP